MLTALAVAVKAAIIKKKTVASIQQKVVVFIIWKKIVSAFWLLKVVARVIKIWAAGATAFATLRQKLPRF